MKNYFSTQKLHTITEANINYELDEVSKEKVKFLYFIDFICLFW